jgi:hypothetical protein
MREGDEYANTTIHRRDPDITKPSIDAGCNTSASVEIRGSALSPGMVFSPSSLPKGPGNSHHFALTIENPRCAIPGSVTGNLP